MECERWLEKNGHPSGRQEQFLSEGCFIMKTPNVSKALEGDIRMEKQEIRYDK